MSRSTASGRGVEITDTTNPHIDAAGTPGRDVGLIGTADRQADVAAAPGQGVGLVSTADRQADVAGRGVRLVGTTDPQVDVVGTPDPRVPDVSIVVPVRARSGPLRRLLASVAGQVGDGPRVEVVVVDNPTPDNAGWLHTADLPFPVLYTCVSTANRGLARNVGAHLARGATLLFADSDVRFAAGAVRRVAKASAAHPRTLVMADVVFPPDEPRGLGTHLFDVAAYFRAYRSQRRLGPLQFRHFVSCCFAVPREDFLGLGGFDPGFTAYGYEDVEFAIRAERDGLSFDLEPARVYHHKPLAPASVLARSVELGRSAVRLVDLHPDIERVMPVGVAAAAAGELHFDPDFDVRDLLDRARRVERRWAGGRRSAPLSETRSLLAEARDVYERIARYGRFTGIREHVPTDPEAVR
jgi:GT2 family glycosyltransferase